MKDNYYVYFHRKKDTNQVFYIGRGQGKRAYAKDRGKYWLKCVEKHGLIIEIVHSDLTLEESVRLEIEYIKLYGRLGYEIDGILINRSLGGEFGPVGFKYSEESKQKMSNSQKGKILSQEAKDKISKAKTGTKLSEESCKKISDSKKNYICTEETRNKISKSLLNGNHSQYYTDEVRKKQSDKMKGRKNPFTKEHIINLTSGHRKRAKTLLMFDLNGNFIKEWISKGEASLWIKENNDKAKKQNIQSQIKDCCFGKMNSCWGYIWKYKKDLEQNEEIKPKYYKINQYSLDGTLINTFNNEIDAKEYIKDTNTSIDDNINFKIKKCCIDNINGKNNKLANFKWEFQDKNKYIRWNIKKE